MQVQFLSCANTNCGIGRYTQELANAYNRMDVDVGGFRKNQPDKLFDTYPYRSLRNLRHYIAPYFLNKAIQSRDADVWHADYVDAAFALPKAKLKKSRLITTVHDAIPFIYPSNSAAMINYKMQLQTAAKKSDYLIVVSETSKRDLVRFTNINPDKIVPVHNGINHNQFFPNDKQSLNDTFLIRYHGGLGGPYKNAEALLYMADLLERWNIDFRLEIAGGHPERTNLPELVTSLSLKNVRFAGFIPDKELRSFLADADLYVYPSKYEGFGFPPLEAMASGTATVSSLLGSLDEVLKNGAVKVDPTPQNLAHAVRELYFNDQLREDYRQRGLHVASTYTWNKTAKETLKLYNFDISHIEAEELAHA